MLAETTSLLVRALLLLKENPPMLVRTRRAACGQFSRCSGRQTSFLDVLCLASAAVFALSASLRFFDPAAQCPKLSAIMI